MDWVCICGRFVHDKRFCPTCKFMRFRLDRAEFLDYYGFRVGSLANGLPFNLPINYISSHVLVAGQTGTGKTRFAMKLAVEAENYQSVQKVKLLIVDVEGEWKNIIPMLKGRTEYYDVASNLRINPFDLRDPALVRDLLKETVFKGIEKEYSDLSAQMTFVLQEAIGKSSNMAELVSNIQNYDGKLNSVDKTKTALMVRLDPFLRSPLKEIFFCDKSNPDFSRLGDCNVVIDLHALDALVAYNDEIRLIYNTVTTYFLRKMLARESTDLMTNLFVADEAQLLVPKILQKIIVTESWPATEFATRLRKRGCGLMLITQSPSNLEQDIVRNTATKIIFRLQSEEDIRLIAASAGFADMVEYEYLSNSLVRLPRKSAIVMTDSHEPFLMTASDFETAAITPRIEKPADALPSAVLIPPIIGETLLGDGRDDESMFIASVKERPFISVRERRSSLGWDEKRYGKTVQSLVQGGLIEKVSIPKGRGRPLVLYQIVGQNPSLKHEYYVNWICEHLSKRNIDYTKSGVGPDIQMPSIRVAINVELGSSDISGNITKALDVFDLVITCSDDEKMLEGIRRQIGPEQARSIFVCTVSEIPDLFGINAD